jgi:hypothetical protein
MNTLHARKLQHTMGWLVLMVTLGLASCQATLPYDYTTVDPALGLPGFQTEHYTIYSQLKDESTYDLAWRLELLYDYYADRFVDEYDPIGFPKLVFFFNDREAFVEAGGHPFMPGGFMGGGDGHGARLMMMTHDGDWGALVQLSGALLYHEAFHQFVALEISQAGNANRQWPTWADEGHATLFNNLVWTGDDWVPSGFQPAYIQSAVDSAPNFIPFEDLLTIDGARWHELVNEGRGWAVYMECMSLVHYMYYADNGARRELIEDYVYQISRNVNGSEAQALAHEIVALEPEFMEWFNTNMVLPDGTANMSVTGATFYEILTAMMTSHLARAHANGQRFNDANDFLTHATNGTLRIAPIGDEQWLPDSLRQEMIWRYTQLMESHGPMEIEIIYPECGGPPTIRLSQPRFGLVLTGEFTLDTDGNILDVQVNHVACPSMNLIDAETMAQE